MRQNLSCRECADRETPGHVVLGLLAVLRNGGRGWSRLGRAECSVVQELFQDAGGTSGVVRLGGMGFSVCSLKPSLFVLAR
jgi:hypothetical protein